MFLRVLDLYCNSKIITAACYSRAGCSCMAVLLLFTLTVLLSVIKSLPFSIVEQSTCYCLVSIPV